MSAKNKDTKIHRKTAERLIEEVHQRVLQYNADKNNPLIVRRMVVFGSYVNSDKELLSDVDIALGWDIRMPLEVIYERYVDATSERFQIKDPSLQDIIDYVKRIALIGFRHKSAFIHLDNLDCPDERRMILFSKYIEIPLIEYHIHKT